MNGTVDSVKLVLTLPEVLLLLIVCIFHVCFVQPCGLLGEG